MISLLCKCGCQHFVWWIDKQRRFSSETLRKYYDREKHPRAVCRDCNRTVAKRAKEGGA